MQEISEDWRPRADGEAVETSASPEGLAVLSTSGGGHISVAAISSDGKYLALGDSSGVEVHECQPSGMVYLCVW